jgi:hypothetical protein
MRGLERAARNPTMPGRPFYRVFISYTAEDLEAHADAASDVIRKLEWVAIDHKYWASSGQPSVKECKEYVESCDILVVLVAHRYGWVPTVEEGGDSEKSITWIEVQHARSKGLQVIPLLLAEDAPWPGNQFECRFNPGSLIPLNRFKAELMKSIAGFFSSPVTVEKELPIALPRAAQRVEKARRVVASSLAENRPDADGVTPFYFDPANPPTLVERLATQLPKRILALEGLRIQTVTLLGYLQEIERLLQVRYSDAAFRLCDYFDLIAGTGFSAPLAVWLSQGQRVADVRLAFPRLISAVLRSKRTFADFRLLFQSRYSPELLRGELDVAFGDHKLLDSRYRTGVCVFGTLARSARTIAIVNHPSDTRAVGSPVRDLILGSMATPTILPPAEVEIDGARELLFSADTSAGPDPALYSFMVATGQEFPFKWRTGKRRLFLLSLGETQPQAEEPNDLPSGGLGLLPMVINTMLAGLKAQCSRLLNNLTYEDTGDTSAAERTLVAGGEPVLTYRRFEVAFDSGFLESIGMTDLRPDEVEALHHPGNSSVLPPRLTEIGDAAARKQIRDSLFLSSFDVRKPTTPG